MHTSRHLVRNDLSHDSNKQQSGGPGSPGPCTFCCASGLAQGSERGSHLKGEQVRLFPGGEVSALVKLVVVDEFGIGPLRPTARRGVDFIWEDADGDWYRHVLNVEEARSACFIVVPIKSGRRNCRVGKAVHGDVVENVVAGEAGSLTSEHERDQLLTRVVVVDDPGGQAHG